MSDHNWDFPDDLPEAAWGIIANAWGGDWSQASPEWREAAERWRDAYHETLHSPADRLLMQGLEAMRATREYIGTEVLPDIPGWAHADWCAAVREHLGYETPLDADTVRAGGDEEKAM